MSDNTLKVRELPLSSPASPALRRVQKAYEQAADQLRELITSGALPPGTRLPNEAMLAREFAVSRTTVREALRLLAAQDLVRTAKGGGGGSYVTLPSIDHISEFLATSIGLLSQASELSLEDFLEARELLEVPAARLAAERRSDDDIDRLRETIPSEPLTLDVHAQFAHNKSFHSRVVASTGNVLLYVAAQPVFSILQTNLARSSLGRSFHASINDHHRGISAAIEARDGDAAAGEMAQHLQFLRPAYEQAWRHVVHRAPR